MAEERIKTNKYSLADLKNTTDDAIPQYLNSLGFKQIHTLTDVRLALGFSACFIAAGAYYYDLKHGFEAAKKVTLAAVIAYFALNTALTCWIWFVEKGTVYVGDRDGVRITLSTHVEKHSPIYHLNIKTSAKQADQKPPPPIIDVTSPFTAWFDENGYLVPAPLKAFLDNSIPELKSTKLDAAGGGGKQEQKHQQKQKQGVVKRERD